MSTFELAIAAFEAGDWEQAETLSRQALTMDPTNSVAWHLLGLVAINAGKFELAGEHIRRALLAAPDYSDAHNSLAHVQKELGQWTEAIASYRQAIRIRPDYADAHNNLGLLLQAQGKLDEAAACYREALRHNAHFAAAHNNLGSLLQEQGRHAAAIACYEDALRLKPDFAQAHNNLGTALKDERRNDEATVCFRTAIQLKPDYAEAHYNLGTMLQDQDRLDEAAACFEEAIRVKPGFAGAYNNLAYVWKDRGELAQALACYRRAAELKPDGAALGSNVLYLLHFCPEYDSAAIFHEHQRWNACHAEPLAQFVRPHTNDRSPDRPLRIGYVSPDFTFHPVGRFMLPLLEAHDRANLKIHCYSSVRKSDEMTDRCRARVDVWRDVCSFSDEQLAEAIRADQIDILVDLTMHMANNRLLTFARKPAPVHVTYLAYCGTTGLTAMDYRFTDAQLDPPGHGQQIYSEKSVYLPTYWCYRPPIETPAVAEPPALGNGFVTFGCFNNFCKVTQPTLIAWSELLRTLPTARLVLYAKQGSHRERVNAFFAAHGISAERIRFVNKVPLAQYFENYAQIDVSLDPFPYCGGTTTFDALWMGVPVVSLAGRTAVGRAGLSILSNLGLESLVAADIEKYVSIARDLASNRSALRDLRAGLRERLSASPLTDAPRFATDLENAYRRIWSKLAQQPKESKRPRGPVDFDF